ncbi:acyl-CoA dehydrogenase family protein [Streptomyces pristinaespiralis]|uniref:Acyl-CoA dehydrogenase domain-containing protein n=2 Tax=Streptomyces pristinaespiralis TaxID=38300 RepID=B5H6S6_STRE2|nr:acyl-CoA dehydrogenase family protein [Streptomyces pristinaespiralis]ALC18705.1 acyl-CoA dehydrogenase [Streptomyces pristinaespiralis]EDY62537.1 acyl-CoA dehydrogenase domain-containing protein [Streptomyces pristinaespiralis ATCC 25486]QMU18132.1 acyl-CoA dehydrogenase family protein [Streptomyces pristinaespiralis]
MAWDFETDPDFQRQLDWLDAFVAEQIEPLDLLLGDPADKSDARAMAVVRPLQEQVKEHGLWACHLGPELGGAGYGQVKLALMNEILGRSRWAPTIFGCQAPDSGNAEILAHFGTSEQKAAYLHPLLDGDISSCYAMTEPQAGADPALFRTRAQRDGDTWVINGEKWFASNAQHAAFFVVMVVTDPEADPHRGMSMLLVPAGTPGMEIVRNVHTVAGTGTEGDHHSSHAYLRFTDCRIPAANLLGEEGAAFAIAQTRLGGGRIHHAMRTIAQIRLAFDMMCERAVSRSTRGGGTLGSLQMTQERVADSWIELEQFRLLVLRTAWLIDKHQDYRKVRKDISAVKAAMPKVLHDVVQRSLHLHGSLGISDELPLAALLLNAEVMGLADGPTEVHKIAVARDLLRERKPAEGLFPSAHLPTRREQARARYAHVVEQAVADQS